MDLKITGAIPILKILNGDIFKRSSSEIITFIISFQPNFISEIAINETAVNVAARRPTYQSSTHGADNGRHALLAVGRFDSIHNCHQHYQLLHEEKGDI